MKINLAILALAAALPACATIASSSGVTVLVTPPMSVRLNSLESNTTVFAFQENENRTLGSPVFVDVTDPGTYDQFADIPLPSIIPAGTTINSYLLHADPDLNIVTGDFVRYLGSVTFAPNETILGVQVLQTTLLLSNLTLGASGTSYPPPPVGFGLEFTDLIVLPGSDVFTLTPDRRTVTFDLITGGGVDTGGVDQMRIITAVAPVPEPATAAFMLAGLGGLMAAKWRTRRA